VPKGLRRIHGAGDWHFITCSCYRRQQFLGSAKRRDLFLNILEEVRVKYDFSIAGYVVMPERFHLFITEPKHGTPPLVMQVLKQRVSRACRKKKRTTKQLDIWQDDVSPAFWQRRYYDFNVYSQRKHIEKLRYMHRNPVKRGTGAFSRIVALEQLSAVSFWRSGSGEDCLNPPFLRS
jgi:REP-associated tyrosine transposase